MFLLNPCHGKYLLVKTEDSSELLHGNKGEADAGPLKEYTEDDGKNDIMDIRGPFNRASASPAPQGGCCGRPKAAEVNQEIVDFVFSELSLGDCQREAVRVDNFQSQVVAGIRYKFDLVSGENSECGLTGQAAETCHVEVYTRPWMGTTEIIWDATSCQRQ